MHGGANTGTSRQMGPGALTELLGQLAHVDDVPFVPQPLVPGTRIGRFEVVREIGRGGFGIVYEARDPQLGRRVALKLLRAERLREALGARGLVEEAEAAARLQHPNVVAIHELGEQDGRPYLVLELLSGQTLAKRLAEGPLPAAEAIAIGTTVARAIAHAHQRELVHRDLKPANVFLCDDGAVKVLDFGLSLLATGGEARGSGRSGGTPGYMSPEQARGAAGDARGDVFALGVMLHQMLTRELPYPVRDGSSEAPAAGATPRISRRGVPRPVRSLVARCIDPDPRVRPRDANEVLRVLTALHGAGVRRARTAAAAAAAVLVVTAGAYLAWRAASAPPETAIPLTIADVEGDGAVPELAGIPTLLATAIEPSRRLQPIPRAQVLGELRRASGAEVHGVAADALARHASAITPKLAIIPRVSRDGQRLRIELRAVDLERGAGEAFVVSEQADRPDDVMAALDRLSEAVRRAIHEPRAEIAAAHVRIAEATTRSIEAYAAYHDALRCFERATALDQECLPLLERAVAIDPGFSLAQSEIAMRSIWMGRPLADVQAAMANALRHSDRLPAAQRLRLMAFAADLDGRETDASGLYQQAAAAAPDDRLLLTKAADFFLTREEPDLALPFWRRVRELERAPGESALYTALTLGALRRRGDLAAFAGDLERGHRNVPALIALGFARANLGDPAGAVDAAREALAAADTDGERAEARRWVVHHRLRSGDLSVERELRHGCLTGALRNLLSLQGRRRELLQVIAARAVPGCPAPDARAFDGDFHFTSSIARQLAHHGDRRLLWAYARRAEELNPKLAASLAVFLAYAGDLGHAQTLARPLYPGSPRRQLYDAVVLWRTGDLAGARTRLRTLFDRNPWTAPPPTLPSSFLYGELLAEMGEDEAAVEALRTFQSLDFPIDDFWTWAYPKSLLLLARSQERLGRVDDARASIEELLALYRRADGDLPLLLQARALQARVARPPTARGGAVRAVGGGAAHPE